MKRFSIWDKEDVRLFPDIGYLKVSIDKSVIEEYEEYIKLC